MKLFSIFLIVYLFSALISPSDIHAKDKLVLLITEAEARQPEAKMIPRSFKTTPSEGPIITFNNPTYGSEVEKPVAIDITFGERLAPIDISSLEVTYLKLISIDITDRVRDYAGPTGIKIANADLPAGSHKVRFSIKDNEGRLSEETLKVTILDE